MGLIKYLAWSAYAFSVFLIIALIFTAPKLHTDYIFNSAASQVVKIVDPETKRSGGTGFAVRAPSGNVFTVTNSHVCEVAKDGYVKASSPREGRWFSIKVLERSQETDLCILEGVPRLTGLILADDTSLGEDGLVVGHPLLYPTTPALGRYLNRQVVPTLYGINTSPENCQGSGFKYTLLDESDPNRYLLGVQSYCVREIDSFYTNMVIYPGNSGSPVVNFFGHISGVVFAGDNTTHWGYVIPVSYLWSFLSIY